MLRRMRHSTLLTLALCLVLAAEGLFTLVFRTILAAGHSKHSELSGTWVMQQPDQARETDGDAAMLPHGTLTLNDDGTFTQHMENYVMVTIVMDSTGKYTRRGDTVTLTGTSVTYSDDGYAKGTHKEPLTWRLEYANDALTMLDNHTGGLVFRREGDKASAKPKSPLRASNLRAVQIVQEVERRYAALNSYSDEGTLTSAGRGPMAKHAKFQTRFVRPLTFLFKFAQVINGEELGKMVVWSDDKQTRLYTGTEGGTEERGLDVALSTISPISGDATLLVPMLLLPDEIRRPKIEMLCKDITLAGEEEVAGKNCYVIGLRNSDGADLKLWIDKSSYLILRAFDKMANATVTYQPKCNIRIADPEFSFTPPK